MVADYRTETEEEHPVIMAKVWGASGGGLNDQGAVVVMVTERIRQVRLLVLCIYSLIPSKAGRRSHLQSFVWFGGRLRFVAAA